LDRAAEHSFERLNRCSAHVEHLLVDPALKAAVAA
jgi:hypothetical protein